MDGAATKKEKTTNVFNDKTLGKLRKELDQARQDARTDVTIVKRIAFLETGLRWTEIEVAAHAFLDKAAAKKILDERFAFMQRSFRETPLALNVAYISWGEDSLWSRLGWMRP